MSLQMLSVLPNAILSAAILMVFGAIIQIIHI